MATLKFIIYFSKEQPMISRNALLTNMDVDTRVLEVNNRKDGFIMSRRYRREQESSLGIRLIIVIVILAVIWLNSNKDFIIYVWIGAGLLLTLGAVMFILYIKKKRASNEFDNGIDNDSIKVSRDDIIEANKYSSKELMTEAEKCFYGALTEIVGPDFIVQPQINLATIIKKESKKRYQNELYRNIDFGIIKKDNYELLLLIELNDKSHHEHKRIERDKKVKEICDLANIPLITFWLNMPNTKDYITSRIKQFVKLNDVASDEHVVSGNNGSEKS